MPICIVDDGLDMPWSIYDSIGAIKHVSVVFFCVKTSSTHYQGAQGGEGTQDCHFMVGMYFALQCYFSGNGGVSEQPTLFVVKNYHNILLTVEPQL